MVRIAIVAAIGAALLIAGCDDGGDEPAQTAGSPAEVAAAGACPSTDGSGVPRPRISTATDSQCMRVIGVCPPRPTNCAFRLKLELPKQAMPVGPGEALRIDFGQPAAVPRAEPDWRDRCKERWTPTDDPATWELRMPTYVWTSKPRGCAATGLLGSSVMVAYGPGGEFEGYRGAYGFLLELEREDREPRPIERCPGPEERWRSFIDRYSDRLGEARAACPQIDRYLSEIPAG